MAGGKLRATVVVLVCIVAAIEGGGAFADRAPPRREATKKYVLQYRPVRKPIKTPTTKLGGQPVWLEEPRWPLGTDGKPMHFIGQVELSPVVPREAPALAYLFLMDDVGARMFEENDAAVIIQPGGRYSGPTRPLRTGPTLYRLSSKDGGIPHPVELSVELKEADEAPPGTFDDVPPDDRRRYFAYQRARREDKIGGLPVFSDNPPTKLPVPATWRLLLQINDRDWNGPFFLDFAGDATAWVMVSPDGMEGRIFYSR